MSPEKNHVQRKLENWKSEKEMYQNNTVIGRLPNFKKKTFLFSFSSQNVPASFKSIKNLHFLAARG